MNSPTNCQHCGAELVEGVTNSWTCGSWLHAESGAGRKSDLCRERAAHQKAEAEVNDARANADSWRVQSDRFESQLLETSNQLAEKRKELEVVKGCFLTAKTALESANQKLTAARAEAAEAMRCLDAACVVQTNTTDRRQWVTYSGWLSPGDSLCEVALPPKNTEAKEGK